MSATRISASRFSARSAPTKSSTNSLAGAISSSAGVAYCCTRPPSRRTAIRSPSLIASSMSWVTKSTVLRISACRRRNSFCRRSRLIGSIAPNGSSIRISGGGGGGGRGGPRAPARRPRGAPAGHADALALAAGELRRIALGHVLRQPDQVQQLLDAGPDALLVPAQELGDGGDVLT